MSPTVPAFPAIQDELAFAGAAAPFEPAALAGAPQALATSVAGGALRRALAGGADLERVGTGLVHGAVNELLTVGALPSALAPVLVVPLDARAEALALGVARGCRANGIAWAGGRLCMLPEGLPVAAAHASATALGTTVAELRGPEAGDVLVGLAALGPEAEKSYLGELRKPLADGWLHALVRVFERGLAEGLLRILPEGCAAEVDGRREQGAGMVAILRGEGVEDLLAWLRIWNQPSWPMGRIVPGARGVHRSMAC